jgi:hypothetical protein
MAKGEKKEKKSSNHGERTEGFFYHLGRSIGQTKNAVIVFIVAGAFLAGCLVGLKDLDIETQLNKLWIQQGSEVQVQEAYQAKWGIPDGLDTQREIWLMKSKTDSNVMNEAFLDAWLNISKAIADITFEVDGNWYTTYDVMASSSPVAWGAPFRLTVMDCFKEGDYDFPYASMELLTVMGLSPAQGIGSFAALDSSAFQSAIASQCGQYAPCLFPATGVAGATQVWSALSMSQKTNILFLGNSSIVVDTITDNCLLNYGPCLITSEATAVLAIPQMTEGQKIATIMASPVGTAWVTASVAAYAPCLPGGDAATCAAVPETAIPKVLGTQVLALIGQAAADPSKILEAGGLLANNGYTMSALFDPVVAAAQGVGVTAADILPSVLVAVSAVQCSSATPLALNKDTCVSTLTNLNLINGVNQQIAAGGDPAALGALIAGFAGAIASTLDANGYNASVYQPAVTKYFPGSTVDQVGIQLTLAGGPTLCDVAQPLDVTKNSCIDLLTDAGTILGLVASIPSLDPAQIPAVQAQISVLSAGLVAHFAIGGATLNTFRSSWAAAHPAEFAAGMTMEFWLAQRLYLLNSPALNAVIRPYDNRPSYKGMNETELIEPMQSCSFWTEAIPKPDMELLVGGVTPQGSYSRNGSPGFTKATAYEGIYVSREWKGLINALKSSEAVAFRPLTNSRVLEPSQVAGRIELTQDQAQAVLDKWMNIFWETIPTEYADSNPLLDSQGNTFASNSFDALINKYSDASIPHVFAGYLILIIYASASFLSCEKGGARYSRTAVGLVGVLVVAASVAAGIGLCAYAGIKMNATSTQVLPFLLLGLGVDDMFVLVHKFPLYRKSMDATEATGLALSVAGPSITLTSVTNCAAF